MSRGRKWKIAATLWMVACVLFVLWHSRFYLMPTLGFPNCNVGTSKWDRDCRTNLRRLHDIVERFGAVSSEGKVFNIKPACRIDANHDVNPACNLDFVPSPKSVCTYKVLPILSANGEIHDYKIKVNGNRATRYEGMEMTLHRDGTLDTRL